MVSTIAHLGVIIYNAISDVKTEMTLNQGCSIYYNQQRQFAAAAALATGYPLGGTARKTPSAQGAPAFADVGLWAFSPLRSVRRDTKGRS